MKSDENIQKVGAIYMLISKLAITEKERVEYINALTQDLVALRTKAAISQAELANLIGVSRQTYSALEGRKRQMSWPIYISLVAFFYTNHFTHDLMQKHPSFPSKIIERINGGYTSEERLPGEEIIDLNRILQDLDDQALHTIKTTLLVEYTRCKNISGERIVKAFEGIDWKQKTSDEATEVALRNIRKRES